MSVRNQWKSFRSSFWKYMSCQFNLHLHKQNIYINNCELCYSNFRFHFRYNCILSENVQYNYIRFQCIAISDETSRVEMSDRFIKIDRVVPASYNGKNWSTLPILLRSGNTTSINPFDLIFESDNFRSSLKLFLTFQ